MKMRATIGSEPVSEGAASNVVHGPWRSNQARNRPLRRRQAPNGRTIHCCKAHHIFFSGDRADRSFEVVQGAVSAYVQLRDGRRQIVDFFFPGDTFGLALAGRYPYNAEAISNLTLSSRSAFDALVADADKAEMRTLFASTVASLHDAHARMLLLGRKCAEERMASFLLLMAARIGVGDGVKLPMSRLDIADYLGLSIETVSRTFSTLRSDGLIALPTSRHVVLLRIEKLRELAGTEYDQ